MAISENFIQFLQSCITPVVLISGVGLLLLTITNRLGRTVDRTRQLVAELNDFDAPQLIKQEEINILFRRSQFLRNSIGSIIISIISSSLIIPVIFLLSLGIDLRLIGYFLFTISILAILLSCLYFFKDIILSLNALRLESEKYLDEKYLVK